MNNTKIDFSKSDVRRKIILPKKIDERLAEFIGVMIGDGHLGLHYSSKPGKKYVKSAIKISGNKKEKEYLRFIMNLFKSLFNLKLTYHQDTAPGAIILRAHSKGIVQFLNKICEIPLNKKTNIVAIPDFIKTADEDIKYAFLRGLADTDYTVSFKNRTNKGHNYPVIRGSFKSRRLIKDLEELYLSLGFKYCVCYNERKYDKRKNDYNYINSIYLNGKKNFRRWIEKIGFSNYKFQRKVRKWQQAGFCPPGY